MMTRASVLIVVPLLFMASCGGGSEGDSLNDADLAQVQAEASCETFAAVFVDAAKGSDQFTRKEGVRAITRAAEGAETAADLDDVYLGLAHSMRGLADGMADRDNDGIRRNLESTKTLCDAVFDIRDSGR